MATRCVYVYVYTRTNCRLSLPLSFSLSLSLCLSLSLSLSPLISTLSPIARNESKHDHRLHIPHPRVARSSHTLLASGTMRKSYCCCCCRHHHHQARIAPPNLDSIYEHDMAIVRTASCDRPPKTQAQGRMSQRRFAAGEVSHLQLGADCPGADERQNETRDEAGSYLISSTTSLKSFVTCKLGLTPSVQRLCWDTTRSTGVEGGLEGNLHPP